MIPVSTTTGSSRSTCTTYETAPVVLTVLSGNTPIVPVDKTFTSDYPFSKTCLFSPSSCNSLLSMAPLQSAHTAEPLPVLGAALGSEPLPDLGAPVGAHWGTFLAMASKAWPAATRVSQLLFRRNPCTCKPTAHHHTHNHTHNHTKQSTAQYITTEQHHTQQHSTVHNNRTAPHTTTQHIT